MPLVKNVVYLQLLKIFFQHVSLTDKRDIVIEQNSDIDFFRDRNSKYYQSNCESKKDKQRNYYAENSYIFAK